MLRNIDHFHVILEVHALNLFYFDVDTVAFPISIYHIRQVGFRAIDRFGGKRRPATTHRAALDHLAADGVDVDRDARVVDDGDLLTCGGVTSGLDLALHLVEREWGAELAAGIATLMEHERRGPIRVT